MSDRNENREVSTNKEGYEGKKKAGYLPTRLSLTIRLLVAAYLVYIVYSLKGVNEKYAGTELVFFIIAMVAFSIIAVFLIIHSLRALSTGRYVGGAMDTDSMDDAPEDPDNSDESADEEERNE